MASLNTLRTKGGLVVSIVIGLALVAFIAGDFVPRSCGEYNVGTINGDKISYMDYSERNELYNVIVQRLYGRDALSTQEQDQVREMAWESLILEHSYRPGFEKMGLWPGETEAIDMTTGVYRSPVIVGTFTNPATGEFDNEQLRWFSGSDDPYNIITWNYIKEQMNVERVMSKYVALVTAGIFVNDLEVENAVVAANRSFDARIVKREYNSIPDSTINITHSQLKAYYDAHRKNFKQDPSREIEYVIFDMLPSSEDYADAAKYVDMIAEEFAASETPMQYAILNSQTRPDDVFLSESQIEGPIANVVWNNPEAVYGPVLSGDTYTIAREAEVRMMPDSIGAKHILLSFEQSPLADSIADLLRKGANFADLSDEFSIDQMANRTGGDMGIFAPGMMVPEFSEAVITANRGDIVVVNTQFGTHVVEVTHKSAPVRKAKIATIKYRVDPSAQTQQETYAQASTFLADAAGSYDNFRKAASEAALSKRVARIRHTDRMVNGINDSRELVRWAFNGSKGDVSDIMEIGGDYLVAAITNVREDGYAKLEDVTGEIRPVLVREAKADIISAEISGKTLAQIEPDESKIIDAPDVSFAPFFIPGVGPEQSLIGAISATEQTGRVSKPVKGGSGVYVFEVDAINENDNTDSIDERIRLESTQTSFVSNKVAQAMTETANVKDQRVRFF